VDREDATFVGFAVLLYTLGASVGLWAATTTVPKADFSQVVGTIALVQPVIAPRAVPAPLPKAVKRAAPTGHEPTQAAAPLPASDALALASPLMRGLHLLSTLGEGSGGLVASPDLSHARDLAARLAAVGEDASKAPGTQLRAGGGHPGGERGIGVITAGPDVAARVDTQVVTRLQSATVTLAPLPAGAPSVPIGALVGRYGGQVRYCYEASLKRHPDLAGRLAVRLTVSGGAVSDVEIVDDTLEDAEVASCVRTRALRWTAKGLPDGDATVPFVLMAGE
jgi:hypothetical protein